MSAERSDLDARAVVLWLSDRGAPYRYPRSSSPHEYRALPKADHDALLAHVERVRGLLHEALGCAVALNLGGLVTRIEQALAQPPRDEKGGAK